MSHIWTFSPESKSLLQRCLSAAAPPDESNKWLQKFSPINFELMQRNDTSIVNDSQNTEDSPTVRENQDEDLSNTIEEMLDPDFELFTKFEYFADKCIKSPQLLTKLAQTFPTNTAEKLFQHVLNSDDLKNQFLEVFYEYFLHNYIKRDNSRFCTEVLLKTYSKYPQYMKLTLKVLLTDLEIQSNILNDFISNLNDQSEFLNIIANIEFTPQQFSHNLFNIYTAYKTCNKTDSIQNFIYSCLKNHSSFCCNDKSYGKLMLAFLQHEYSLKRNVISSMGELIEVHKTPFKRPCLSILKEINEDK